MHSTINLHLFYVFGWCPPTEQVQKKSKPNILNQQHYHYSRAVMTSITFDSFCIISNISKNHLTSRKNQWISECIHHITEKWNRLQGLNDARYSSWTAPHQQLRNISLISISHPEIDEHPESSSWSLNKSTDGEALSFRIIHSYNHSNTDSLSKQPTYWSMSWLTSSMYLGSRSDESLHNLLPYGCICVGGRRKSAFSHTQIHVINLCL